jgi:hypothetical protein
MITDSNQACFAKMTGRRLQEELNIITLFLKIMSGVAVCGLVPQ